MGKGMRVSKKRNGNYAMYRIAYNIKQTGDLVLFIYWDIFHL